MSIVGENPPIRILKRFIRSLKDAYRYRNAVGQVHLSDLFSEEVEVVIKNSPQVAGNVHPYELTVLGYLVAAQKPKTILEIGTFSGNTALHMALNSPEEATVYTLDLPVDAPAAALRQDPDDLIYVQSRLSYDLKYLKYPEGKKVVQKYGDSAAFDFGEFKSGGLLDFIFIDGSHSYEYVKSDTEKSLQILRPGGSILWHDYTPNFPGVFRYLNGLKKELPIRWIEGTRLVYYKSGDSA